MGASVTNDRADDWLRRLAALEVALTRAGRADLVAATSSVRSQVATLADERLEVESVVSHVARFIGDVRACVVEPGREMNSDVIAALERAVAQTRHVASRATTNSWADALLSSFGSADSSEMDALVDTVTRLEIMTPSGARRAKDELGTLREPLKPKAAGTPQDASNTARVLMKGELQPGLLADLIQLFSQNSETGQLVIDGTLRTASIFFKDGRVTDAVCEKDLGEKGFFEAMQIREGRFSYQRGVEAEEVRIFRSAQHLIMDTLRIIDETA